MNQELIIDKIKKLLALAEGTTNLNEASAAFEQAQRLLTKHKLSQLELNLEKPNEKIGLHHTPLYVGERKVHWKRHLAYGIARFNSCNMITRRNVRNDIVVIEYILIGRTSDIQNVEYFYNSIATQIETLSKKALADGLGRGKTFTNNFKWGAAETVLSRLNDSIKEVEKEYQGTQALVLVNNQLAEVDNWVNDNLNLSHKKSVVYCRPDETGTRLGRLAGQKISLSKALVD